MTHQTHELALLRAVLDSQLRKHPLPWRVERDWAFEVTASDGAVIVKCPTNQEAEALIVLANARHDKEKKAA